MVTRLAQARNERDHSSAKELRRNMYRHIGNVVRDAGDKIAGYAIVVWDADGYNWSTLKPGGPIKSRMLPSFVHDATQQHVILDLVDADTGRK